jgi:LysM repeat protein
MARGRKRRSTGRNAIILVALVVVAGFFSFKWMRARSHEPAGGASEKLAATTVGTTAHPERSREASTAEVGGSHVDRGAGVEQASGASGNTGRTAASPAEVGNLLKAGRSALASGDLLTARAKLSAAFEAGLPPDELGAVRAELTRIAEETVFSQRATPGDPLVEMHTIRPGDSLAKIAGSHFVTADLLARINGIKNKNRIRAGQRIKVVKGPFHAVVTKGTFDLSVYVQDTFVHHFSVGLGADDGTPTGEWRVKSKLTNPTYYPPRGGKIMAADDAENPLGERWIGLEGISGDAQGQERYGIHGTIEPDSVGRAVSMGCIRLRNDDVEFLFDLLVTNHSRVTVRN